MGRILLNSKNHELGNRLLGDSEEQIGKLSVWITLEWDLGYLTSPGPLLCPFFRIGDYVVVVFGFR